MSEEANPLLLKDQLCFPLYAASKELTRRHKPYLEPLGLTYTQYVTMLALWERDQLPVKELGKRLYLDSATLTPLLKRLEARGYVTRRRSQADERSVIISLTTEGRALRERALDIPQSMAARVHLDDAEVRQLKLLLQRLLTCLE